MRQTIDWGERLEAHWGNPFVHESGHALMAIIQDIPCHGICYDDTQRFCALCPDFPSGDRSRGYYLFLAAGAAAEQLIYGVRDEAASLSDRAEFSCAKSPEFEEVLKESVDVLAKHKRQLKRLISLLKAKVRDVDLNLERIPETDMNGSEKRFRVLLTGKEIAAAVTRG